MRRRTRVKRRKGKERGAPQSWITLKSLGGRFLISLPPSSPRRKLYSPLWREI